MCKKFNVLENRIRDGKNTKEEIKIIKALFIFGEKWKGMLKFYGNKLIFAFIYKFQNLLVLTQQ